VEDGSAIRINPLTAEEHQLWTLVLDLAEDFGPDRQWTLIGGLMVQLHAFEHQDDLRATQDVDLLGDARRSPQMTAEIAEVLIDRGAEVAMPPRSAARLGYRFELEGSIVEVLGPDGLAADPRTIGELSTLQIPGGTQALGRREAITVSLADGPPRPLRRPDLLGAILLKGRAVSSKRRGKFDSDRQDLIRLLSYVESPRDLALRLNGNERKWLEALEKPLGFDDPALRSEFPVEILQRAHQALLLLLDRGNP
jgi:hypothetical protein